MTSIYNIHTNLYKHTNIVTPNAVEPLIVNFQMSKLPLFSVLSACLLHKTKYCLLPLKLKKTLVCELKTLVPNFPQFRGSTVITFAILIVSVCQIILFIFIGSDLNLSESGSDSD